MNDEEADDFFSAIQRKIDERKALAYRLAGGPGGIVLAMNTERQHGAMITPDAETPGFWRITWFDVDGFSGHTSRSSKFEAMMCALSEGYADIDRNRLDRLRQTHQFHKGNEATEIVRRINEARAKETI